MSQYSTPVCVHVCSFFHFLLVQYKCYKDDLYWPARCSNTRVLVMGENGHSQRGAEHPLSRLIAVPV